MRLAARMTTGYDVQQDRLCLSVLDQQRRRTRIWLTQRLAGRIIPALLERLQGVAGDRAEHSARLAARRRRVAPASPAAVPDDQDEERLPSNIRIATSKDQTILLFDGENSRDETIAIPIDSARLRQWLRIFYRHYKRAGWPLEIWPRWFERDVPTRPTGSTLH
jgi:hypothetical protein